MKTKLLAGIALATAVAAPGAMALADPAQAPGPDERSLSAQPEDWAGYAHVGYHLDPHWRLELQGGYHEPDASPASNPTLGKRLCLSTPGGPSCDPSQPALGAYSEFANLVFDAMPAAHWVDPFVGVGVSRFEPGTIAITNPAMRQMQTGPLGFANLGYQAVVGLAFRPRDRLHFDVTYRWTGGVAPGLTGMPTALSGQMQDQIVAISVRYALSEPPTAIPPMTFAGLGLASMRSTPLARTVVVETPNAPEALADEAAAAVDQAAVSARQGRPSDIVVDGHADTASAATYNSRMPERRAKAMADAMVALGVSPRAIDVRWNGEATRPDPHPAVQAVANLATDPK